MMASNSITTISDAAAYAIPNPSKLESVLRGTLGIVSLTGIAYLFSVSRKSISWKLVISGIGLQLLLAVLILKVPGVQDIFTFVSKMFIKILSFTDEGSSFLLRSFVTESVEPSVISFAFKILPTVIFFSALTSLLFYLGILQRFVYVFAWLMKKTLKLSGAESLAAAGNIFLGQTESPLLIKHYIDKMTKSELMCLMSGGMATIAGGVLAAYIGYLGGDDPQQQLFFARHLITASIISAPAAIVAAKIIFPETEKFNEDMSISNTKIGDSVLEAISNGTTDGLKLAVNVGAMLLVFIAMVAMVNYTLSTCGEWIGLGKFARNISGGLYSEFSMEFVFGYVFAPLSWIIGIPTEDILLTGQLLGQKTVLNEFFAYYQMGEIMRDPIFTFSSEKSVIMTTYALCGFANFASIGIQIGGIGSLAPLRKSEISKLGFKALIAGTLACFYTATIVGFLF